MTTASIGNLFIHGLSELIGTAFFKYVIFFMCFEKTVKLIRVRL